MKFRYCLISLSVLFFYSFQMQGQGINDYRVIYGLSYGYRSFNLDETNARVNFLNDANLKPDRGSSVFSANIKSRPFNNNNFFVSFRFDFVPKNTRKYFAHVNSSPEWLVNSKSGTSDTLYSYDIFNTSTVTKMYFASVQIGYDIPVKKFRLSLACGAVYGSFNMYQFQNDQNFEKFDHGLYYPGQNNTNIYIYQTKNNFGVLSSAVLSYPLYPRLNADFSFSLEIVNPEITFENGSIWVPDGYFGVKDFGFYYPKVLSAQLSGIQVSLGLSYILF